MRKLILFTAAIFLLASCYRKPLYDECICYTEAMIPISADWEQSGVIPQNVTVMIYDTASGELVKEHIYEDNDEEIQSYVYLPIGEYTAVIFNEKRDQIDYVSVDGYDNLETLRFFANDDSKVKARVRSTDSVDDYIQQPGGLAVQVIEDLNVTADLITYTYNYSGDSDATKVSEETRSVSEMLTGLVPVKKTSTIHITLHVEGINNAIVPALVDLRNIASGYMVSPDRNTTDAATLQFDLGNRVYDYNSPTNGTLSADLVLFGSLGDRMSTGDHTDLTPVELDILFTLVDAEATEVQHVVDITQLITFVDNGVTGIELFVECSLAEPLPDVIPEVSDGGWGTELEPWSDSNDSYVTL